MKAMAENDPSALALLYDRHAATLFALCLRILRDAEEAEEVLEDVFFQLWQRADAVRLARGSVLGLPRDAGAQPRHRARAALASRALRRGSVTRSCRSAGGPAGRPLPCEMRSSTDGAGTSDAALAESPRGSASSLELSFLDGLSHPRSPAARRAARHREDADPLRFPPVAGVSRGVGRRRRAMSCLRDATRSSCMRQMRSRRTSAGSSSAPRDGLPLVSRRSRRRARRSPSSR